MGTVTKQRKKVPKLRFNGFNEPWQSKKLKDCLALIIDNRGKTPPTKSKGIPMIEVNAIGNREIDYSRVTKYVDQQTYNSWFRKHLVPGDILFSTVGATALCSFYDGASTTVIAQNIVGLRFKDVSKTFAYYLLTEPRNNHKFKRIQMSGVQPSVKVSEMIHLYFDIPEIDEQQKIADFLGSVDAWLDNLRQQKTTLETYKRGMLQKLFTQQVRFKDEEGKGFPAWRVTELSKIAKVKKGQQLGKEEMIKTGIVPVINGGISASGFTDKANTKKDTITISEGGNSCGFVSYMTEDFWCGGHCYSVLVGDKSNTVNSYLFSYLKYKQMQIMKLRVGSGLPNIQKRDIDAFSVLLPDKREQQKIADFLTAIDETITAKTEEISKVELWKKGLMQKMFV